MSFQLSLTSPAHEAERLRVLRSMSLLDSLPDPELDRLTAVAARSLSAPICLISLVDESRIWFKSRVGTELTGYPREKSFCGQVVLGEQAMVCHALAQDPRYRHHELVQRGEGPIQFYAGAPVWFGTHVIGTLCVMDSRPRPDFGAERQTLLNDFAQLATDAIRARQLKVASERERQLLADGPVAALVWEGDMAQPTLTHRSGNLARVIGGPATAALSAGAPLASQVQPLDADALHMALLSHSFKPYQQLETVFRMKADGRWIQLVSCGDHDDAGRLLRVRGYLSDITRQKQLEASIDATREHLHLALESAQIGTWDVNLHTGQRQHSDRIAEMLGWQPDELPPRQEHWKSLIHPFDVARVRDKIKQRLSMSDEEMARMPLFSVDYRMRHRDGHYIWVQSFAKLVERDAQGQPLRAVGTLTDITHAKAQELLRTQRQRMLDLVNLTQRSFLQTGDLKAVCEALFDPLLDLTDSHLGFIGVVQRSTDGRMVLRVPSMGNIAWDEATRQWYESQMLGDGELIFFQLDNPFGHVVLHDKVVCTNQPASHPASRGTPRGHPPIHSFLGIPLHHEGEVVGMIALANRNEGYHLGMVEMLEPLTTTLGTLINARATDEERSRTEAQLLAQATSDSLTGLANRRRFFEVVEHMLPQIRRYGQPATVALVDLDHFKQINDQFGHATGDAVLRAFGPLLEAGLRETDLAARIGGEEFAVFMPSTTAAEALIPLERIRQELAKARISSGGSVVQATASIGVCEWRPGLESSEAWLAQADEALYRAKAEGRNCIRMATSST